MEDNIKIIELLNSKFYYDNDDGFCIIHDNKTLFTNQLFLEHLEIKSLDGTSVLVMISEFEKEKITSFITSADKEDCFINPNNFIFWTLLKYHHNSYELLIIKTNDLYKKLLSNFDFINISFLSNNNNLLTINDEKTFYDTLEFIPDYVVVTDLLGKIIYVSSNVISKTYYTTEELIGSNILKYVDPSDKKIAFNSLINFLISKEVNVSHPVKLTAKNGGTVIVDVNTKPFFNTRGNLLLLHTVRDITRRIELEKKLTESEISFKNTILHSPFGVHLYSLNENNDLIFVGYNNAAEKILGIDHKNLINKKIEEAFPGASASHLPDIYKRIAKTGENYFFEQIDYKDNQIQGAFEVHAYQTFENHMAAIFNEISARKKNEQELKRLEREYRNIFDNAPYAIFQTTFQGRFVRINKEGANLLGYDSPEDVINNIQNLREEIYYNPEDRDRYLEKLMKSDGYVSEYIQFKKKNGEAVVTETIARIVKDESGKPIFLEGFVKDLSKEIKAESELKKIYTEQQTIFDSIPASICYKDLNNNYLRVNKAAAKFLNKRIQNIIGKSAEELFPKHIAEKFYKEDLKVIKSGKPLFGIIDKLIDKNGNVIWIKTDRIPYFDDNGNITGVITLSYEFTQQYEAEEKARKYLDYLEFMNKTALDLLKIKNLDDIYAYIIQGINVLIPESSSVVLSYDEETKIAQVKCLNENLKKIFSVISDEQKYLNDKKDWTISERYMDFYKQAKLIKMEEPFEEIVKNNLDPVTANEIIEKINFSELYVIGICKDEILLGVVFVFPKKQLSDYSKHVEAFMYQCALAIDQKIAEDKLIQLNIELEDRVKERTKQLQNTLDDLSAEINVRKVIEKELINAKLELTKALVKEKELNELKSRFIDMISHEYRTPLTVILSSIYLIESYSESGDIFKVKKHTEKVKKSVDIMTNLIEHVLTIGRGDAEKIIIEKRWFEIDKLIKDVIDEVMLVDKDMHPINLLVKSNINQIFSDSRLVRQILTNLILNSVKYSEINKPVEIEVFNDLENIEIIITDHGHGIEQDDLEYVFDAFFRGRNQIGLTSGTGLGLTIVKRFVEFLNGKITVESKINEGTKFKVVLPSK